MKKIVNVSVDLQSMLDTMGLLQGTALGIMLLLLHYRKLRTTFFLGLFLLLFSLKLAYFVPSGLDLEDFYPELFLLPVNFSWLLFPLFLIYTQQVSTFSSNKKSYWVLIPGILSFFAQLVIYFFPYETKLVIAQSFWHHLLFTYLGIFYSWAIGIWNLRLLNHHRMEVMNTFSQIASRELQWARIFLIYSLITSVVIHILYYVSPQNFYYKLIFSIFDLIAIYWVSIHGILQPDVLPIPQKNYPYKVSNALPYKESKHPMIARPELEAIMKNIEHYMKASESYVRTELNIIDLAEKLNVHPKRISTAINSVASQNFNTYINQLRIKKAKMLLKNKNSENFSIEGIGKEVGFHSKSAFYTAFKKVTGTTPSRYLERVT